MLPLDEIIRSVLKETGVKKAPKSSRTFKAWSDQLTDAERNQATPVRFFRGTLTVEVSSGVFLHELKNIKNETYRTQANKALGEELIRKVSFRLKG